MEPYLRYLYTYVSVSGPHLGYLYSSNTLLNSGLWLFKTIRGSQCIRQLTFTDDPDIQNTYIYKLCKVVIEWLISFATSPLSLHLLWWHVWKIQLFLWSLLWVVDDHLNFSYFRKRHWNISGTLSCFHPLRYFIPSLLIFYFLVFRCFMVKNACFSPLVFGLFSRYMQIRIYGLNL